MEHKEANTAPCPHDELEDAKVPLLLSVEDIIEQHIGHLNTTQVFQTIFASLSPLFDSFQTFSSIFLHAQPSWHCTGSSDATTSSCQSNVSDLCSLPKTDWSWDDSSGDGVPTSIISEWDLECASSFLASFPATSYFVGCLLGGLVLATMGDSLLGRKNLLSISCLVMSLAGFASAFAPNVWVYSMFRFVCGVGRAPLAMSVVVLLTERVAKRWRSQAIMVAFMFSSFGIMVLTGIAYLFKEDSWRTIYLYTSIPGIIFAILAYFFMYESPRWLLLQGRNQDAINVLTSLSSHPMTNSISPNMPNYNIIRLNQQKVCNKNPFFASFHTLISSKWALRRLVASMLLSFGIGLMYFGMFLGVENLGSDIYVTSIFHSLLALSSFVLTFLFWIPNCNRKVSLFGFCTFSGATSIVLALGLSGGDWGENRGVLTIGMELVSMFSACMAYNIVTMYVMELFPTCVRSSASSLVRQAMILGSVFDPMLVLLGSENMVYSYGVFGLVMLLCGFLVMIPWLPETRGKTLCDTMEEQELRDDSAIN